MQARFEEIETKIQSQTTRELDELKNQILDSEDRDVVDIVDNLSDDELERVVERGREKTYNKVAKQDLENAQEFYGDGLLGRVFTYIKDKIDV